MQTDQPGAITAEMNVTPMIDVLLVLLIIAMILLQLRAIFPINVPPERPPVASPQPAIVLELDASDGYLINGLRVTEARLEARLRALFLRRPTKLLFVRAPGHRAYREVVHAIDVARSAGVEVIGYMP